MLVSAHVSAFSGLNSKGHAPFPTQYVNQKRLSRRCSYVDVFEKKKKHKELHILFSPSQNSLAQRDVFSERFSVRRREGGGLAKGCGVSEFWNTCGSLSGNVNIEALKEKGHYSPVTSPIAQGTRRFRAAFIVKSTVAFPRARSCANTTWLRKQTYKAGQTRRVSSPPLKPPPPSSILSASRWTSLSSFEKRRR